jgi:N4-gp56 family major capsid protein
MADTSIATSHGLSVEQWEDSVFSEYLNRLVFAPFMGTDASSPIMIKEVLIKQPGDTITIGLRSALSNAAVEGTSTLEGNEEALNFYNQSILIDLYRNGVRIDGVMTNKRTSFDIRNEAKAALVDWLAEEVEDRIAAEFSSINGVAYASATETQKDQWSDDNEDRVLFGAATSNTEQAGGGGSGGNDHSASLLNVDGTNDVLSTGIVSLARRLARLANPKIRPMRIDGGVEMYLMFAHPLSFRDLVNDSAIQQAQREVFPRMGDTSHPLLVGQASLWWDGVLIVESERVPVLSGVGNAGIDVAVNVLMGSQAIVMAQGGFENGSRVKMVEEGFDYDAKTGFALSTIQGHEKARFNLGGGGNSVDHGMVTVYTANVSD